MAAPRWFPVIPNTPPEKPEALNGDHGALWDFLHHINGRVDRLYVTIVGGLLSIFALAATILGIVISRGGS